MPKIKPIEIKSGDLLDPVAANQIFEEFRDVNLDNENFRNESINQKAISKGVVFSRPAWWTHINDWTITGKSTDALCRPNLSSYSRANKHRIPIFVMAADVPPHSDIIVRVNMNIKVPDYGSRTFRTGHPPVSGFAIYYHEGDLGVDGSVNPVSTTLDWTECPGTMQRFSRAFSSKIPSASGLEENINVYWDRFGVMPSATDRPTPQEGVKFAGTRGDDKYAHLDTRNAVRDSAGNLKTYSAATTADFEAQYNVANNNYMWFDNVYNYTAVYRHRTGATHSGNVNFTIFGSMYDPTEGLEQGNSLHARQDYETDGCKSVELPNITVSEIYLTAVEIRM